MRTIWWVRRDFRLRDNPALGAAVDEGSVVLPLFVLDPALLAKAGPVRTAWLQAALWVLDADLRERGGPGLSVVLGRPATLIPRLARQAGAPAVHVSADFGPYGRRRDRQVARALAEQGVAFTATGSPYGVAPGTLIAGSGRPFQVFTPFYRAWADRGVHSPAPDLRLDDVDWLAADDRVRVDPDPDLVAVAGEDVALRAWHRWLERDTAGLADYADLGGWCQTDGLLRGTQARPVLRCRRRPDDPIRSPPPPCTARTWAPARYGHRLAPPSCTTLRAPTPPHTCPWRCGGDTCTRGRCWRISARVARREPRR